MSSLDKKLLPDEEIIFRTQKHWIIFATPFFLTLVPIIIYFTKNDLAMRIIPLLIIAAALAWIIQLVLYLSSEFAVTNRRVMMKEGFIFRHTNETRLATIANASVDQSIVGQILNYGAISIHSFGGSNDPFMQIARPNEFQKYLQTQLDKIAK
jgi:uncharacterized membrane protein YdbT with pleckstrin-like domain